jgi:Casein kinase II regulatory subunit
MSAGESSSTEEDVVKWITWFLRMPAHKWMIAVDEAFIEDAFNLYGLKQEIGHSFKECIETMLGPAPTGQFGVVGPSLAVC